jgi:hypothetical protein
VANTIVAIFFIEMDNRLGVAVGIETVTKFFQAGAKFGVIIDFTVKNDPNVAAFVAHWLVAAGQIHNAQPSETKRYRTGEEPTSIIRPAMTQNSGHGVQLFCRKPVPTHIENSADSAHSLFSAVDLVS